MRLTDLRIKQLRAPEIGQKTHYDDLLPGFGVRVSQGGSKSFVMMYGEKRRLKTLGRYPALSLAEARIAAKQMQAEMHYAAATPAKRRTITFTEARDRFLADSAKRNKPRTAADYRRLLHRHFSFKQDVADLTRADLSTAIDKLSSTVSEQQHAFVAVRTMMNWCVKQGFLDQSPVPPLTFRTKQRERVLTDAELRTVWRRAIEIGYPYGQIVQLLILTGLRRGEVSALRRSWIAAEDNLLVLPADFTKNRREHRLPLGKMVRSIMADLPEMSDLLFPARGSDDRCFNGWGKSKERFDEPLEIAPYTHHDLRRTFSSNLARLGTPIHVTEKLLNHVSGTVSGVAAIYNRYSYLDEMRAAIDQYDQHLAKLIEA